MKKIFIKVLLVFGLGSSVYAGPLTFELLTLLSTTYDLEYQFEANKNGSISVGAQYKNYFSSVTHVQRAGGRLGYKWYFAEKVFQANYMTFGLSYLSAAYDYSSSTNSAANITASGTFVGPYVELGYKTGDSKPGLYIDFALTYSYLFGTFDVTVGSYSASSSDLSGLGFKTGIGFLF